ncbi:MAG: cephalosporin hydroxylase [Crenarchaeota archaeon]|nr:MAG: cephalosporin hydroxylase [Thermoproteota archaeon]RDJ33344.1 MAG: cephalosporin hydroxylase [Thermoproteota archaeon]RDJ36152.1 MAG: cephalosporin hydroxylase [Thermoproteota archaeon]RDJ38784.1 MAG: cephalosporin hydroxylase [Thermoproteota archaeon]
MMTNKKTNNNLIEKMGSNIKLKKMGMDFIKNTSEYRYSYNFSWLGMKIIQFPQDMIAVQEIIWKIKPDLIIETGIAHGGSLVYYASILEMIGKGQVVGIDVDIRKHNLKKIQSHVLKKRIRLIQGSSIDEEILRKVDEYAVGKEKIMVLLDSDHSHKHVLKELQLYSRFVTKGSYIIVFDTAIQDMPNNFFPDRPWNKKDNPKTAVYEFLRNNKKFEIDKKIENKLLITVSPDGYLKCIRD